MQRLQLLPKGERGKTKPTLTMDALNQAITFLNATTAAKQQARINPFKLPEVPKGVIPSGHRGMAMDNGINSSLQWASTSYGNYNNINSAFAEGMEFLGYPYLAALAQRAEYRVISETIAGEMTRKWIKFNSKGDEGSKNDKIKELDDEFKRLNVQDSFRRVAEYDGFMGRAHLFIDLGYDFKNREEQKIAIGNGTTALSKLKCPIGALRALRPIEAVWAYPTNYNSNDPLENDWYKPKHWFVMGTEIHITRLLTFIGREVPDLLKPAYSFGGLSMSQIAKPYIDNWLNIRQNVANITQAFSILGLKTNLSESLQVGGEALFRRIQLFNLTRNNGGCFIIDKDTEEFWNVAVPLGTLDALQAQAQEHMACLTGDSLITTDRGLVPIELVTVEDKVLTREGWAPLIFAGKTGIATDLIEVRTEHSSLKSTSWHPIFLSKTSEFVAAGNVRVGDLLLEAPGWRTSVENRFGGVGIGTIVVSTQNIITCEPVYNLEVAPGYLPEFYANGILVHNSVARIPLVKLLGIQPTGLNASSEGEIRTFYDSILEYQTSFFKRHLTTVMYFAMLNIWGEIDKDISFEFNPLWSLDEKTQADIRETDARTGQILVDSGIVSQEEERRRVANDPNTPYDGLDVEDMPELKEEEEEGLVPKGGGAGVRAVLGEEPEDRGGERERPPEQPEPQGEKGPGQPDLAVKPPEPGPTKPNGGEMPMAPKKEMAPV